MVQTLKQLKSNFELQKKNGKLTHAYLFIDAGNTNQDFIKDIISLVSDSDDQYFNLYEISLEEGKKNISVDQIRQLIDSFQTVSNQPKIAVIQNAQAMSESASNAILKFIEEPGENQYIFLIAESETQILPTIISRTQVIKLPNEATEKIKEELLKSGVNNDDANLIARISQNLSEAQEIQLDGWFFNLKKALIEWTDSIKEKNNSSFYFVENILLPFISDKEKSHFVNSLLIEILLLDPIKNTKLLEQVLTQLNLLKSNISIQTVYEMISIRGVENVD